MKMKALPGDDLRLPPHDVQSEKALLGCLLVNTGKIDEIASRLRPEDFYVESHEKLFSCLLSLSADNVPIETPLIVDRLRSRRQLDSIGGMAEIAAIAYAACIPSRVGFYADIISRHSMRRRIIRAAQSAVDMAYDMQVDAETVLSCVESSLSNIRTGKYENDPRALSDVLVEVIMHIDELLAGRRSPGIPTGIDVFDERFGGVFPGELTVLAARPGQGKTSLALQWANHAARLGYNVYFATLEMDAAELTMKRLCSDSGVSNHRIRSARIGSSDRERIVAASQLLAMPNFILHDWPEMRPHDIQRAARRCHADIVFVDYLQIVSPPDTSKKRHEQVGDIAKRLKIMAREMKVPVVACAQIGRQVEQSKDQRPRLHHLRESGDIENHADVVALLWRPDEGLCETYKESSVEKKRCWDADLDIAKNRKGQTTPNKQTRIRLDWDGAATQFKSNDGQGDGEF